MTGSKLQLESKKYDKKINFIILRKMILYEMRTIADR